jgi:hypothetical protein
MASRGKALIFTVACFAAAIGCGGRTDTLFDDGSGLGGFNAAGSGQGGGSSLAGNTGRGGFGIGGSAIAGGFGLGGASPTAGTHSGGAATAGGVGFGGFGNVGNFAGSLAFGGSGAIGGVGQAGAGGTGGIVGLCVSAAPTACDKCLCQGCGSELTACFSDLGCALIFACVQQQQCQGFSCYQNSTCRGVIDQFGGLTGPSVSEVFSLASCSVTARANCGCN